MSDLYIPLVATESEDKNGSLQLWSIKRLDD